MLESLLRISIKKELIEHCMAGLQGLEVNNYSDSTEEIMSLPANQSLDWVSSLNLSMVEYHTDTGNYFRDICRFEERELNTHQKKKGKRKSTGQESVGVISQLLQGECLWKQTEQFCCGAWVKY